MATKNLLVGVKVKSIEEREREVHETIAKARFESKQASMSVPMRMPARSPMGTRYNNRHRHIRTTCC